MLDNHDISVDSKLKRYILLNFSHKNYKDWADLPQSVTSSEMDNARSRFRVHINVWIMLAGSAVCFAAAVYFKRVKESGGVSWTEANQREHAQWAKDYKRDN